MVEDKTLVINKRTFDLSFYEMELEFNNSKILEFIKNKKMTKEEMFTTFYENNNILEEEKLLDFKNYIYHHLHIFAKNVLNKEKIKIHTSWFQVYTEDCYHPIHIHGVLEKNWSLIYYIQVSVNSSKTIMHIPGFPYVPEITQTIEPKKDKLIVFPSYFPHQVELNKDNSRIILSANFDIF